VDDERAILDVLLADAQEGEEPDPAVDGRFTAVHKVDGDGGGCDGHADHLPLVSGRLRDEDVNGFVQDFDAARLVHLHDADHPVGQKHF